LFVHPEQEDHAGLVRALGCIPLEGGPSCVTAYPRTRATGETTPPGVYAAGDHLGEQQTIAVAVGTGARAAQFMAHALAMADAKARIAGAEASEPPSRP